MAKVNDNTPIIVGIGQSVSRETPTPENTVSAFDLAGEAGRRAIADTNASIDFSTEIDVMTVSRLFEDSTRKVAIVSNPFGSSNNVPGSIARRIGIAPKENIYCAVGGQTPQRLVNQMSERIHRGEIPCLAGRYWPLAPYPPCPLYTRHRAPPITAGRTRQILWRRVLAH